MTETTSKEPTLTVLKGAYDREEESPLKVWGIWDDRLNEFVTDRNGVPLHFDKYTLPVARTLVTMKNQQRARLQYLTTACIDFSVREFPENGRL